VIVAGHGPFTWGTKIESSVINAEILEFVAQTTFQSYLLKIKKKLPKYISNKHYERKHGKNSYYGQK
jgi:L-ribulose-5-phosphate 4-epimerase